MNSSKFKQVFASLPPEAQQIMVEKHLATLIDVIPKESSKKILLAATNLQRKSKDAPKLDLRAKRKQIGMLFDELARDAKISFIKERSNREELLAEIVHSLVAWINDIWSVVYEYQTNFYVAHTCLLFIADALAQLSGNSSLGGCKCSVMNLPIRLEMKDTHQKSIKRFSVMGPQNLDRILLWVWRDLFVSLLANGTEGVKKKVPEYLDDIESCLGVNALERLLYGGKPSEDTDGFNDGDSEDEEDSEDEDLFDDHFCGDEDSDSDYETDRSYDPCACGLHAKYWPERFDRERITLRKHVETHLFSVFEVTPSLPIYNTLMTISQNAYETDKRVDKILSKIEGDTASNVVAALDIRISNNEPEKIISLLDSYSYLLRPRDAVTLQCAVALFDSPEYHSRGLAILEKELTDCMRAIYNTVRSCFSHIEDEDNKKDLQEILKLRNGSSERKARVEAWGERVVTPLNGPMHPMAFAAMMMGLPMMPGGDGDDDADLLSYVDFDQDDPDLDDLRDEYRPNLKAIFEGWNHLGQTLLAGPAVLAKLYIKALEYMPWLRTSDVVSEMANRLRERPNKLHALEALLNMSAFAKYQRKKLSLARAENQRRSNANKAAAASAAPVASKSTATQSPVALSSSTAPASRRSTDAPVASSSTSAPVPRTNTNGPVAASSAPSSTPQPPSTTVPAPAPAPAPNPVSFTQSAARFVPFAFGGPSSQPSTSPPVPPPFPPVPGGMEDVD